MSEYRQQVQCEAHVSQQSLPVLQICTPVLAKSKPMKVNEIHMVFSSFLTYANLSEAIINRFGLTPKYLPFPHPTSRPIDPSGRPFRKLSTIGHGLETIVSFLSLRQDGLRLGGAHLVSRGREVRCNLLIDIMDVLFFILPAFEFRAVFLFPLTIPQVLIWTSLDMHDHRMPMRVPSGGRATLRCLPCRRRMQAGTDQD